MKAKPSTPLKKLAPYIYGVIGATVLFSPFIYFIICPQLIYWRYSPKEGDVVFQSLSHASDLVRAIEGVTESDYSHCGIVFEKNGKWFVNEALGKVTSAPLKSWIKRGRGFRLDVYRFNEESAKYIPDVINALSKYQNKPYDARYRLDDEKIYCSELVYKAYRDVTGEPLGELVELQNLKWEAFKDTIEKYENGPVPMERKMITPLHLSKAEQLNQVARFGFPDLF